MATRDPPPCGSRQLFAFMRVCAFASLFDLRFLTESTPKGLHSSLS